MTASLGQRPLARRRHDQPRGEGFREIVGARFPHGRPRRYCVLPVDPVCCAKLSCGGGSIFLPLSFSSSVAMLTRVSVSHRFIVTASDAGMASIAGNRLE